MVNSGEPNLAK